MDEESIEEIGRRVLQRAQAARARLLEEVRLLDREIITVKRILGITTDEPPVMEEKPVSSSKAGIVLRIETLEQILAANRSEPIRFTDLLYKMRQQYGPGFSKNHLVRALKAPQFVSTPRGYVLSAEAPEGIPET